MISSHSLAETLDLLASKKLTCIELINHSYDQINKWNKTTNALITVIDQEEALNKAKQVDQGKITGPLAGMPFVLKDSYMTSGIKTTAASKILQDYISPYDATVYSKLLKAGAILVGKANMDAWGHGGTSENSAFGAVRNPWNLDHVAGGSSGGCGVAVATGMAAFAIGEDTGGSIRNPASWTNTTGLKVTYGRVSRYGCIAYASSFDTVGPIAKTVEDCALVLEVIAGPDNFDATCSSLTVPKYSALLNSSLSQIKIGIPRDLFEQGLDRSVKTGLERAETVFTSLGASLVEIDMPLLKNALAIYYLIAPSETSSNLARFDGVRYGASREMFGAENIRRIMIGTYALSSGYYDAYYRQAQKARTLLIQEYQKAFDQVDLILMPVTTGVAPKIGEVMTDPLKNMLLDVLTTSQNPAGVPSLALPAGFENGLPFGVQLVGKMFSEDLLFNWGHAFQQETKWLHKTIRSK